MAAERRQVASAKRRSPPTTELQYSELFFYQTPISSPDFTHNFMPANRAPITNDERHLHVVGCRASKPQMPHAVAVPPTATHRPPPTAPPTVHPATLNPIASVNCPIRRQ